MPVQKRSYAMIGLGGVGGYYGARLAAAGHEVHFIARSDYQHVRTQGLVVESPVGDIALAEVSVHRDASTVPVVDTAIVAVKTTDTAGVLPVVKALVEAGTPTVVAMQNGLGVEQVLADAAAGATVLGAMCFVCTGKVGPGHIRHLDYGRVTVGEHRADGTAAGATAAVSGLVDDLKAAGVPATASTDLAEGRWRKLVWNIPYNGLTVVLDAGTDVLMAAPSTRSLIESLMHEVLAGARACGHPIDEAFLEQMLADTLDMTPYAPSMKLDFAAGRPMELAAIYAAPLAAARAAGCQMVRVAMLHDQLRLLDDRN